MAITINNNNFKISPVYNKQQIVLDSTNKTKEFFRYVVDLTVDGIGNIGKITLPPQPVNGYGIAELNNILRDYIKTDINYTVPIEYITDHFLEYTYIYGERFKYEWTANNVSNTGGNITLSLLSIITFHDYVVNDLIYINSPNQLIVKDGYYRVLNVPNQNTIVINQPFVSGGLLNVETEFADKRTKDYMFPNQSQGGYVFDGAMKYDEWSNYDNNYVISQGSKFITTLNYLPYDPILNETEELEVYIDDFITVNFFVDTIINNQIVIGFDKGSFIYVNNLDLNYGTLGVGPKNILSLFPLSLEVGDTYYVWLSNPITGTVITRKYKFKIIERPCKKFKNNKIVWLDRLGGWKSFNFDLHSIENLSVQNRTIFKKENLGTVTTLAGGVDVDTELHQNKAENVEFDKTYNVNCDRITQSQIIFLEDLFTSRYVYLYELIDEENTLRPIDILDNNYELSDLLYRRRKTLSLNYKFSEQTFNN